MIAKLLAHCAQVPQIVNLCGEGVLKPFCDLLAAKDDKTVGVVLDGVSNILATAEKLAEVDKVKSTNVYQHFY